MEDDTVSSIAETPGETTEDQSSLDKQYASLQTYLDSLPYACESVEDMNSRLEHIVAKIFISAHTKNWLVLTTWDGMLQCWLLMRYPLPKVTRAKLVHLYYELCMLPGIEPRVIRSWADMLSRLLANKPGMKRKLESADLELPWRPLWRMVQKELEPKEGIYDPTRNLVNILLYVAELCKRYYPPSEIPAMLDNFIPLLTKETLLTMLPVLTSFLPPTFTDTYLPTIFNIWEAFNSSVVDDRLLDLAGDLSEEHVAGTAGEGGMDGGTSWKDVGIWTESQWNLIIGKGLSSMNVPVGAARGPSNTGQEADTIDKAATKIKKPINRINAFAKILVYSMSVDGEVRENNPQTTRNRDGRLQRQSGFIAGSRAIDSLDQLMTSTESFFHPSNSGPWTAFLTTFIQRLSSEFLKRLKEEELPSCKTPVTQRLTPAIKRAFVTTLKTPALLAMFSKDPLSMSFSQGALRSLAMLEPGLLMPELLERAYSGLEVVNETHRTTAVLSMLSGIARPLVTEKIWLGGQKHLVPLLELCIPGIDLNDPTKTICSTMFIVSVVQHIKIGDVSIHQTGMVLGDVPPEEMDMDDEPERLPDGMEAGDTVVLSKDEERSLVRDSTAGFADWVISLFRRVFALYENLPEEGGKKNTTGGKQEESVLKSIKSMLDVICLHLSDSLFDLVLNLVFNYATTNAKSNAVRAFGQLVACLARVKPEKTMAKFLPFCILQIEEELKHGASSVRTTSTHTAVPSDTTLHWNMAILRGCLGYGGSALLKYRHEIFGLLSLLVEKTRSERGYGSAGRLVTRILNTVAGVYPINSRFVNSEVWGDPSFDQQHNLYWGRFYEAKDVVIEWHVPSSEEITFVLDFLDQISAPALDKIDDLLKTTATWDNVARNDFCRYLNVCKSIWAGLPTFYQESEKDVVHPCLNADVEIPEMIVSPLIVEAGFTLTDPKDPRYQKADAHRRRFGELSARAASALLQNSAGEDHIDAVLGVTKAIDTYLLAYGLSRSDFDAMQKNYAQARDLNRSWVREKENSRLAYVKRAHVYHSGRVYMHALYRRRSELDDKLLSGLVELSLSPYTRVRRQAQSVLHNVCGYYIRSTRFSLPTLFNSLEKGNDPDRMKGALYILWNKGTAAYALADQGFYSRYLLALLKCQHEEKPSIQKLVNSLAHDCLGHLSEEAMHTDAYLLSTPGVDQALEDIKSLFSEGFVDQNLLKEAIAKAHVRVAKRGDIYTDTVSSILELALRPTTHWRYVQMALRFLSGLLRRDVPTLPAVATFFMNQSTSPQPTIRVTAQKAVVKLLAFVKIRTYAKTSEELWFDEWRNPLCGEIVVADPATFSDNIQQPISESAHNCYVDKIRTGFLAWTPSVKCYQAVDDDISPFAWETKSQPCIQSILEVMKTGDFIHSIAMLWSQESSKSTSSFDIRTENVLFTKSLAKIYVDECLDEMLAAIDSLISNTDKFKQRGAAEMLLGLWRGSKHWPKSASEKLWSWTRDRLNGILTIIKPETISFWENIFLFQLEDRDPRRNRTIVEWITGLPLDFSGDSAFDMSKSLSLFAVMVDSLGMHSNAKSDEYIQLLFDNANTDYAEIRQQICQCLYYVMRNRWQPYYPSTRALIAACETTSDPLKIRESRYMHHVTKILDKLPQWRQERLPPPRVAQSEYDKVGLTLLQWIWASAHGAQACLSLPYAIPMMPEILRMSELNDNSELQAYSSAVLYVLSAVSPSVDYIEAILENFVTAIKSSTSWRIRLHALPALVIFFYRNLLSIPQDGVGKIMDVLLDCLADENVEVREMASKVLSGVIRCSQRQSIIPLKNRFITLIRKAQLPTRRDPAYSDSLKLLHSAVLGICALIESLPYSVEPWMPPLTEVLAPHATDPPPISTTIRKCASEFKKTHQDTWAKDQLLFNEEQLQSLSTMLVGTSYYA